MTPGVRKGPGRSTYGDPDYWIEISEMLGFSARNGILQKTECFPMARVNQALDRVRRNQARYRVVLVN